MQKHNSRLFYFYGVEAIRFRTLLAMTDNYLLLLLLLLLPWCFMTNYSFFSLLSKTRTYATVIAY